MPLFHAHEHQTNAAIAENRPRGMRGRVTNARRRLGGALLGALTLAVWATGAGVGQAQNLMPIRATLYATGFTKPIAFIQDPSTPAHQVVVEQGGRIRLLINGAIQPTDFLDLSGVVTLTGPDERGLLGFAFAPDYGTSGRVFASFTDVNGNSVIARFTRSTVNPLTIDFSTRFDFVWPGGLPYIVQPATNHNGGNIAFGPDGYLYVGFGDGGSGNDPWHNAQTPTTLLGKMLRLDVSVANGDTEGYDVPPSNPFVGQAGVLPEIWSFGWRNPWRWSFDNPALGGTGAMVVGDVGQSTWEEIDYEPALAGGRNYGWRNREGAHDNIGSMPPFSTPLTDPITELGRADARSITGGYVYRGSALGTAFQGRYLFADFAMQRLWSLGLSIHPMTGEASTLDIVDHTATLGIGTRQWSSFGVDAAGEVYAVAYVGQVYRLDPATPASTNLVQNGQFSQNPPTPWTTFAAPDPADIVWNLTAGVLQFYRRAPAAGVINQAVISQQTPFPLPARAPITATFSLGNTDSVRKRVSVLVHDSDFSDLAVCTFWLPPGLPLTAYTMLTYTTESWSGIAVSFYAASTNALGNTTGFYQIDNVSVLYAPGGATEATRCIDPLAPPASGGSAGPDLVSNGTFTGTMAPWAAFGTVTTQVGADVLEIVRATTAAPAGVVLQGLSTALGANEIVTATFQLGNSSPVRKRVTVLLHDAAFQDLAACTFWIAPGQSLQTYLMRAYASTAWGNATVSFYPSTIGPETWTRIDNVVVQRTPGAVVSGTNCVEPGGVVP